MNFGHKLALAWQGLMEKINRRQVLEITLGFFGCLILLSFILVACKSNQNQEALSDSSDRGPSAEATPIIYYTPVPVVEYGITNFAGIGRIEELADTTALISWAYHEDAAFYVIFKKVVDPLAPGEYQVAEIAPVGHTSALVQGLTIDTPYSFMVKAYDSQGRMDNNEKALTGQTTLAPQRPVSVMLKNPPTSPGFISSPTFTVRYVKPGETVRIFKDANCTQELANGVVALDKNIIDLTSSPLQGSGLYQIYANSTNIYGNTSACSTAYATYQILSCPNNTYLPVEGNADIGTEAFCVMQTEARAGDNNTPLATFEGSVWNRLTPASAKSACRSLSYSGFTCDLISNPQWMTIARDIEATDDNWSEGEVGMGSLNRGHSDKSPASPLTISDSSDPWDQTGNTSGNWAQKRTHILSNGGEIWDFAGNLMEMVDWTTGGNSYTVGPRTCAVGYQELYDVDCAALTASDYLPANPADIPTAEYNHTRAGLGKFYGTAAENQENALYAVVYRGGWYNRADSGIYYLELNSPTSDTKYTQIGFRCTCMKETE